MKNHRFWLTRYRVNEDTYGSSISAVSRRSAMRIAKYRGLGETVEFYWNSYGETLVSGLLRKRKRNWPSIIHAATWLSYLAEKSNAATIDELYSDKGLFHETVHAWAIPSCDGAPSMSDLVKRWRDLEQRIPGVCHQSKMRATVDSGEREGSKR